MTDKIQASDSEPGAVQPGAVRPPKKQDRTTFALLAVAAMIAIGGVGFAVGRASAPATAASGNGADNRFGGPRNLPSLAPGQTFGAGQFGGFRDALGGISGTVVSIDATTMTVKLADGSTVTVLLTGTTSFHSQTAATAGDVQSGTQVRIQLATGAAPSGSPTTPGQVGGRTLTAGDVLITGP